MDISLKQAVDLLKNEQVVALATETVYGLAASAFSPKAINQIYTLKNRPQQNPLIVHVYDVQECLKYALPPESFAQLTEVFWPGPLTCILPVKDDCILPQVRANLPTCAFRCPSHPLIREVLREISPLVAPSANISGRPSSTKKEHIENDFGKDFPVLASSNALLGIESTIIAYQQEKWCIARQGAISQQALEKHLGYLPEIISTKTIICPGQLLKHYAPKAKLQLSTNASQASGYVVGYSDRLYPQAKKVFLLGKSSDPDAISMNLYDMLRALDAHQIPNAFVDMDIPRTDKYITIIERLERAAL